MRLDLGCGLAKAPGHIGIDLLPTADIGWDLNEGLPLFELLNYDTGLKRPDSKAQPPYNFQPFVEGIRCHQVLEHLDTIIPLMNDCFSVLKPGGLMEISSPYAGTKQFYQDPTHKRAFVEESFLYFAQNSPFEKEQKEYGITARFEIVECKLDDWNLQVVLKKPE